MNQAMEGMLRSRMGGGGWSTQSFTDPLKNVTPECCEDLCQAVAMLLEF